MLLLFSLILIKNNSDKNQFFNNHKSYSIYDNIVTFVLWELYM